MRATPIASILAAALMLPLSSGAVAQDEVPVPDDREWRVVSIVADGEQIDVPLGVYPSLLMSVGSASGFGGCNRFSTEYVLDGSSLTFDEVTTALAFCYEPAGPIEDAYLAALPQVAEVETLDDSMTLYDAQGSWLLEFEEAGVLLTEGELAELLARIMELQIRVEEVAHLDDAKIEALGDRIKDLEQGAKKGGQGSKGDDKQGSSTPPSAFTGAEKVLLKAIPANIRKACEPRRESLPGGSIAAVQCTPDVPVVRDMAYYLLDGADAERVMNQRMREYGMARRWDDSCSNGTPGRVFWVGGGNEELGCYVDANGRANLRLTERSSGCDQLRVDGKLIKRPHLYVAVLGEDGDIAALRAWQEGRARGPGGAITRTIQQKNVPPSPSCPS